MNLGTCSHPGTHRAREFPLKRRTFLAERKSMGIFPVTSRKENSLAMSTVVKTLPDFPLIFRSDRRCLTQSPGNSTDSLELGSNRTSPWSVLLGFSLFPNFSILTGPGHSPTIRLVQWSNSLSRTSKAPSSLVLYGIRVPIIGPFRALKPTILMP